MTADCKEYLCLWIEICVYCLCLNSGQLTCFRKFAYPLYMQSCSLSVASTILSSASLEPATETSTTPTISASLWEGQVGSGHGFFCFLLFLACRVHTCGAWAAQTCRVIAGGGNWFADIKKLVQRTAAISFPF
jgi:hypothetical protein